MFEYIRGTITEKSAHYLVIETQGLGYKIWISRKVFDQLPDIDMEFKLLLKPVYSENDQILYGFTSFQDRLFFNFMLKVRGIGAKVAISTLSIYDIGQLVDIVLANDIEKICLVPGIGKKTAERMIIELRDTFQKHNPNKDKASNRLHYSVTPELEESSAVLLALGYSQAQIQKIIKYVLHEYPHLSTQEIVKKCLVRLSSS